MSSPILLDTDVFSILWQKRPGHEEISELLACVFHQELERAV
jgi:hypothetical protein